jgi:hypothetical protein
MRLAPLLLLVLAVRIAAAERPFDYPVTSGDARFDAVFTQIAYEDTKSEGTKLTIKDREHNAVFTHEISSDVACNARWTHDSKSLVITGLNGAGHQPWHYHVFVFSFDARELRQLDEPEKTPFVSAEIFMQSPHTVILIGHTFEHDMVAPDDPVLLRFDLATLWPRLPKV